MCRLFGFRSNVQSSSHRSLVEAENALARQAQIHPHGWGIGWFTGRDAYVLRSDGPAAESKTFRKASERLRSETFVVHVRRATVGEVSQLNLHPFRCGRWLMAHNGTIFGFSERIREAMLAETLPQYADLILGTTDSEHLFYYLLSALRAADFDLERSVELEPVRFGETISKALGKIYTWALDGGFVPPILNVILTDGEVFLAQRAGKELFLATQKVHCGEELSCAEVDKVCLLAERPHNKVNHLIVASEKIGSEDSWEEVEQGHMVVLDVGFRLHFLGPPENFSVPETLPDMPVPQVA
jgi:glutamine amidotransferase